MRSLCEFCPARLAIAMATAKLAATINSIRDTTFFYPYCITCLRKINPTGRGRWTCPRCGQRFSNEQVRYRYRLCVRVTDGRSLCNVVAFGPCLDKMFGATADDFRKYLLNLETAIASSGVITSVTSLLHEATKNVFCGRTFMLTFKLPSPKCLQECPVLNLRRLVEIFRSTSRNAHGDEQLVIHDISLILKATPITTVIEMIKLLALSMGYEPAVGRDATSNVPLIDVPNDDGQPEGAAREDERTRSPQQNENNLGQSSEVTPKPPKSASPSDPYDDLCQRLLHDVTFSPWVHEDQPRTSVTNSE